MTDDASLADFSESISDEPALPDDIHVVNGEATDVLATMDDESVHACVCDPPYGLNFMPGTTNGWDDFEPKEYQEWCEEWASDVLRVLKPGGHLIAFSGHRTQHRLFTGVEDAGFTVRDTLTWLQGSGMPKGSRVARWMDGDDVDEWEGWRTDLKPAAEYAALAQKPPSESSYYRNVLEHGTGALNIDACRVGSTGGAWQYGGDSSSKNAYSPGPKGSEYSSIDAGRYPATVMLDDAAARHLDEQAGEREARKYPGPGRISDDTAIYGEGRTNSSHEREYLDSGGPSRYYYTAKASTSERTHNGEVDNDHPTVKPVELMRWLVRLVTAEGQRIIDPFAGSGTTLLAAAAEGREAVGIEKDDESARLARKRLRHRDAVTGDDTAPDPTATGEAAPEQQSD